MHLQQFEDVAAASTKDELRERMTSFTHHVDFDLFAYVLETTNADGSKSYRSINNAPLATQKLHSDNRLAKIDPVHTHLRTSAKPILWTQKTYVDAGVPELWDNVAPFGYQVGIGVSMPVPGIGRLLLGVDRSRSLPSDPDKVARVVSDLQLLTAYTQDTVIRALHAANDECLTPQQLSVLQLVSEGKSNSVIGSLLGISENTVKFHVQGIFRRLQVATREQAVMESCRRGLLS